MTQMIGYRDARSLAEDLIHNLRLMLMPLFRTRNFLFSPIPLSPTYFRFLVCPELSLSQ